MTYEHENNHDKTAEHMGQRWSLRGYLFSLLITFTLSVNNGNLLETILKTTINGYQNANVTRGENVTINDTNILILQQKKMIPIHPDFSQLLFSRKTF